MTMKPLLVALLLASAALTAAGQEKKPPIKHLNKPYPDLLYFVVSVTDDCPGTEESYEEVVEGELLRARIKQRTDWVGYKRLFLRTEVSCAGPNKGTMAHLVQAWFAKNIQITSPIPGSSHETPSDEWSFYIQRVSGPYGTLGFTTGYSSAEIERVLRSILREAVSDALTDYLKANFSE